MSSLTREGLHHESWSLPAPLPGIPEAMCALPAHIGMPWGETVRHLKTVAAMIAICRQCPAIVPCQDRADALRAAGHPIRGVWAGKYILVSEGLKGDNPPTTAP